MKSKDLSLLLEMRVKFGEIYFREFAGELFICREPTFSEIDSVLAIVKAFQLKDYDANLLFAKQTFIHGDLNSDNAEEALFELGEQLFGSLIVSDDVIEYKEKKLDKIHYGPYRAMLESKIDELGYDKITQMKNSEFIHYLQTDSEVAQTETAPQHRLPPPPSKGKPRAAPGQIAMPAPPGFDIPNIVINT